MKKKWHLPFLLVLILGTWLAYQQKHPQERYIREEQRIFGTVMHVQGARLARRQLYGRAAQGGRQPLDV